MMSSKKKSTVKSNRTLLLSVISAGRRVVVVENQVPAITLSELVGEEGMIPTTDAKTSMTDCVHMVHMIKALLVLHVATGTEMRTVILRNFGKDIRRILRSRFPKAGSSLEHIHR